NGDGYSDVVIGAGLWGTTTPGEGRAFVYLGGAGGLATTAVWVVDPTDQVTARFGYWVASAGDVNGDGYADVLVGASTWDGTATDEGRAYLFLGGASGPSTTPAWVLDPTDQMAAKFGAALASAGDVNGDGYSDVVVGANQWAGAAAGEGRAYLF